MNNSISTNLTLKTIEAFLTPLEKAYDLIANISLNQLHDKPVAEIKKQLWFEITTLTHMQRSILRCEQSFTNKGEKPHKLTVSNGFEICLFCPYSHKVGSEENADITKTSG